MSEEAASLDVIINGKGAQDGASSVIQAAGNIKSSFIDLAAKAYVVEAALTKAFDLSYKAAVLEETMGRLNRQMGQFGSTSALMVTQIQQVTRGIVSISEAATMASRGLAVGLDPSQILAFVEAGDLLSKQMGTQVPEAFDEIVTSIISGRSRVLGNIVIYVDLNLETQKLAVATGRTTEQITKREKAMIAADAITKQLSASTALLSGGVASDADRLEKLSKDWENFYLGIAGYAKSATISSLLWWDQLKVALAPFAPSNMAKNYLAARPPQGVDYGPPNPGNLNSPPPREEPPVPMPTSITTARVLSSAAIGESNRQADYERTRSALEAQSKLYETDAQRQFFTAQDLIYKKGEIAKEALTEQLAAFQEEARQENLTHRATNVDAMNSLQEQDAERQRHATKVAEINNKISATAESIRQTEQQNQADR